MKLFHHPISSSSRRVDVTVAQLGLTLESRLIDLRKPEDVAELATVNPNRKIPALHDPEHDLCLWESHAIMQYLCDRTPGAGAALYPTELAARADVNRWLFWVNAHLAPTVGPINYERMWKKFREPENAAPDPAVIARYERFLHVAAAAVDKHLADRTWVAGKSLTLADISIVSTLMYRVPTQLPLDAYQHIQALIARVEALNAWTSTEPTKFG